jgi:hypothetical protein
MSAYTRQSLIRQRLKIGRALVACCALVMPVALPTPLYAQSDQQGEHTTLDNWQEHLLDEARDEATSDAIEYSADQLKLTGPMTLQMGVNWAQDRLVQAANQYDLAADNFDVTQNLLENASSDTDAARTVVRSLQSELQAESTAVDLAKYIAATMPYGGPEFHFALVQATSDRAEMTQAELSDANVTLDWASEHQGNLEGRLASAESELRDAGAEVNGARQAVSFYSDVAPRLDTVVGFAAEHLPLVGIASDVSDIMTTPRSQRDEVNSKATDLLLDVAGYAMGGEAFAAAKLVNDNVRDAEKTYNAFQYDNEARNLAFSGGALSSAVMDQVRFTPQNFNSSGGSFRAIDSTDRFSMDGRWSADYSDRRDQFDAESRYSFNQLSTYAGHAITGTGTVSEERIEYHNSYEHQPLLAWMNAFSPSDGMTMTETSRRYESDNESFNRASTDQAIQQADRVAYQYRPQVSVQPAPIDARPYEDDIVKRPPSVSNPPVLPPRPEPNAFGNGYQERLPQPQPGGVLMTTTVKQSSPTAKGDSSKIMDPDDGE